MNNNSDIYVSTSGCSRDSLERAREFISSGISNVELSGGSYVSEIEIRLRNLKSAAHKFMLHNYFPPTQEPFVMNLASLDDNIRDKSIKLAKYAIDLSGLVESKYYGVHAGFLVDPEVAELGKPIAPREMLSRELGLKIFIESILTLSDYAVSKGIKLLVENNVLSNKNLKNFHGNPFLMVEPEEIRSLVELFGNRIGLLLDLGHLNVSSNSLGFGRVEVLLDLADVTVGYHVHSNDGLTDQHLKVESTAWYLPHLRNDVEFFTLEVHSQDLDEINTSINNLAARIY